MLTKKAAASYCGLSINKFEQVCPVMAVAFENGTTRYDIIDIDAWLDFLKSGGINVQDDQIVAKLKS